MRCQGDGAVLAVDMAAVVLLAAQLCELSHPHAWFCASRCLEGVSMRRAADWLGVAPATVQRALATGASGSEPPKRLGAVGGL